MCTDHSPETTSRRALAEAGFDIIEEQQPSFLFGRSVLITGEVARTTGYEPAFPPPSCRTPSAPASTCEAAQGRERLPY